MYIYPMHSTELVKGNLQTIILKVLDDHGRMYGYELTQKVKALSQDTIVLTDGALYPTLHRMEAEGWLTTETEKIGRRVRKYYTITTQGRDYVAEKIHDFAAFVQTMIQVLNIPHPYATE